MKSLTEKNKMESRYFFQTEEVVLNDLIDGYAKGTPAYFIDFYDRHNVLIVFRDGRMYEELDRYQLDSFRDYFEYKQNRTLGSIKDCFSGMKTLIVPNVKISSLRTIEEGKEDQKLLDYF